MNRSFLLSFVAVVMAICSCTAVPQNEAVDSNTDYAAQALQPYVDSGQLPGAISVFYKDGVQETCCVGYADVAAGRRINMKNSFIYISYLLPFLNFSLT